MALSLHKGALGPPSLSAYKYKYWTFTLDPRVPDYDELKLFSFFTSSFSDVKLLAMSFFLTFLNL